MVVVEEVGGIAEVAEGVWLGYVRGCCHCK